MSKRLYVTKTAALVENEEGLLKRKNLGLLVEAVSFTDAEANTIKYWGEQGHVKQYEVEAIRKAPFIDVVPGVPGEPLFIFKMAFISVNESGKEKEVKETYVISSQDIDSAIEEGTNHFIKPYASNVPTRMIKVEEWDGAEDICLLPERKRTQVVEEESEV